MTRLDEIRRAEKQYAELLRKDWSELTQGERRFFDTGGILNALGNFQLAKGQHEREQRRRERF